MAIRADLLRGNTDTILLRFLNEEDNYGYAINQKIMLLTDGQYELNEATLYTSFKRLEQQELIRSYWGNEESGARRKYYQITEKGKQQYQLRKEEWAQTRQMLERLIYE